MKDSKKDSKQKLTLEEIDDCIAILETLTNNAEELVKLPEAQRIALLTVAGRISRPNRDEDRKRQKEAKRARKQEVTQQDRKARAVTGIRAARVESVFSAPKQLANPDREKEAEDKHLNAPRNCLCL